MNESAMLRHSPSSLWRKMEIQEGRIFHLSAGKSSELPHHRHPHHSARRLIPPRKNGKGQLAVRRPDESGSYLALVMPAVNAQVFHATGTAIRVTKLLAPRPNS